MFTTEGADILSEQAILKRVSEFDIFKYYISGLEKPNKPFCSELRKDHSPTCRVSLLSAGYRYKDFGTGDTYTCFTYVQARYGLKPYEALRVISTDFRLDLGVKIQGRKKPRPKIDIFTGAEQPVQETKIKIVPKKFDKRDLQYWMQYNISPCLLKMYNIISISHYYINNTLITIPKQERAYAYSFGNYKYKILRPDNPDWKWTNNAGSNVIQGLKQIPYSGDLLFITSSLKDVISLRSIGLIAVAPQSENTVIDKKLVTKFKEQYKNVVLYYNNDQPGIEAAKEHSSLFKIPYICHLEGDEKDPSDFIKENGVKKYKEYINKILWQVIEIEQQEIILKEKL
jgi:hypothetical protein